MKTLEEQGAAGATATVAATDKPAPKSKAPKRKEMSAAVVAAEDDENSPDEAVAPPAKKPKAVVVKKGTAKIVKKTTKPKTVAAPKDKKPIAPVKDESSDEEDFHDAAGASDADDGKTVSRPCLFAAKGSRCQAPPPVMSLY